MDLARPIDLRRALRLFMEVECENHPYLRPVKLDRAALNAAAAKVQRFELEDWAKREVERVLMPQRAAFLGATTPDAAELESEFLDAVKAGIDVLNESWKPQLEFARGEALARQGTLSANHIHFHAWEVAEALHREHRVRCGTGRAQSLISWVDADVETVKRLVLEDLRRGDLAWVLTERSGGPLPGPDDEAVREALDYARQSSEKGWIAYIAADRINGGNPNFEHMLRSREKHFAEIARATGGSDYASQAA